MKLFVTVIILTVVDGLLAALFTVPGAQTSLRLVQILYRHGDRTPIHTFPTDLHQEHWQKIGLGKLTNIGKEQQYELGQYLRKRYTGFLNRSYLWDEVIVNSTNVDRTLMSAASNLAGLYPPTGDDVWNVNIPWQPIPVHTTKLEIDYVLNPDSYCPRYEKLSSEVFNSSQFLLANKEYKELYDFLSVQTNLSITNFDDASELYDTFKIEKFYNLTLPSWLNDSIFNEMKKCCDLSFKWDYITDEERLLRGGPLLGHMIDNMKQKINNPDSKIKIYIFSSHDTAIAAFLSNLNLFNDLIPPYAASVIVELHQFDNGYHVQILYRNDSRGDPNILTITGCEELCHFEKFASLLKDKIPYDVVEQCGAKPYYNTFPTTNQILIICSTVAFLGILIGMCWRRRQAMEINKYIRVETNDD